MSKADLCGLMGLGAYVVALWVGASVIAKNLGNGTLGVPVKMQWATFPLFILGFIFITLAELLSRP